jgi:ABC-2 type transport system permease protein
MSTALAAERASMPSRFAHDLDGVRAVWIRELIVFKREKSRVISSLMQPLLWIFVFGGGLGASVTTIPGGNYQRFILPGIVIMSTMFACVFYGMYIVWDKKLDVLKQVMVSPVSRWAIFSGKVLGGSTDALIQATLLLLLGVVVFHVPLAAAPAALAFLTVAAFGLTSLGLAIGSFFDSPEGFQVIFSSVIFPMFLLSGATYPLENLPAWLMIATRINPLTYAVDALRGMLVGYHAFPYLVSVGVVTLFSAVSLGVGLWSFSRTK